MTQAFVMCYFCGGRVEGMDIFSGFVELSFTHTCTHTHTPDLFSSKQKIVGFRLSSQAYGNMSRKKRKVLIFTLNKEGKF